MKVINWHLSSIKYTSKTRVQFRCLMATDNHTPAINSLSIEGRDLRKRTSKQTKQNRLNLKRTNSFFKIVECTICFQLFESYAFVIASLQVVGTSLASRANRFLSVPERD